MDNQQSHTEFAENLERKLYAQKVIDTLPADSKAELFRHVATCLKDELDNTSYSSDTKTEAQEIVNQVRDVF